MKGYYKRPGDTAGVLSSDGWLGYRATSAPSR